jgi:hypothetical protein
MIEPRLLIYSGAAVSVVGHLAVLILGLLFADAHPFESRPSEAIAVEIVAPDEVQPPPKPDEPPPKPEPKPVTRTQPDPIDFSALTAPTKPQPSDEKPDPRAAQKLESGAAAAAAAAAAARPKSASGSQQAAAAQPDSKPQGMDGSPSKLAMQTPSPPPPPAPAPPATPGTEPDITVKYGVMLGLPQGGGDYSGIDAPAYDVAKLSGEDISAFRRHLKTCAALPASIAPTDKVRIVLRVLLTRDGKLAADPALIEASASAKGPALMQKAIDALQACQPHTTLPADKYDQWKVLDLSFTPQDFSGG